MDKAPDAYRTISEVAEDLDLPQHVLRFWETRFGQIKPLKRGGGRRYYRPDDVELLKGIRHLLYKEGYTIKGVQRILKEQGVKAVQAFVRESLASELASPPPPAAPRMEAYVSKPAEPVLQAFAEHMAPPVATPSSANWPSDNPAGAPDDDTPLEVHPAAVEPASLQGVPLASHPPVPPPDREHLPAAHVPAGQVSMFRGGLQRESEAQSAPLSEFAAQIRERVEGASSVSPSSVVQGPMTGGRDALLIALEELVACRQTIDQILARRQS